MQDNRDILDDMIDSFADAFSRNIKGVKNFFAGLPEKAIPQTEGNSRGTVPRKTSAGGTVPRAGVSAVKKQDPERKLLLALFQENPWLAGKVDFTRMNKASLLALAREAYCRNDAELIRMRNRDDFINGLHSNMVRDSGMLGVMRNLLEASRKGEAIRWKVYSGYARNQMENLLQLEQNAEKTVPGSLPENMTVEKLVEQIRKQLIHLRRQPSRTGYLPLYGQLKRLSFREDWELSAWYAEASAAVKRGLEQTDSYLRQALEEEYQEFTFSSCDGMNIPSKDDNMQA